MQSDAKYAANSYVDDEVAQRLLKALDSIAFFATATFCSTVFAERLDLPNGVSIITFFSLTLALLCVLLLRDLGLYKPAALVNGGGSFLKSAATLTITGTVAYNLLTRFLFPLDLQWIPYWVLLAICHLALSRLVAQAWARPRARQGRFRKRIAIVGGGKVAADALHTLEASRDLEIDIIGLFDDRDEARSPQAIRKHRKVGKIIELAA